MIEYIGERLLLWTAFDSQRYLDTLTPPAPVELLLHPTDAIAHSLPRDLQMTCANLKSSLNVRVIEGKFGTDALSKKLRVSPDAFMQMSIQCAWRRLHGTPVAT
jgi:hypothetical protein